MAQFQMEKCQIDQIGNQEKGEAALTLRMSKGSRRMDGART